MPGPTETTGLHVLRPLRVWIAALAIVWLAVVATEIRVRGPYIDEGFYSLSAHNFVAHGDWGAREVEPSGFVYPNIAQPLTRIDRRAYFYMPLQVFIQTAWVEIVGWGLIQHRVLCTLFGIAGLILWFRTLQMISDSVTAAIATVLIAFDCTYITDAGFGRMDLMGQTFGIAALYFHERYFASHPWLARFLSALMLAAALMVHPYAFAVWAAVYMARSLIAPRSITISQIGALTLSSLIMFAFFGWWISYDPQAFRDQLLVNSAFRAGMSRFNEVSRYLGIYGVGRESRPAEAIKVLPLIILILAYAYLVKSRRGAYDIRIWKRLLRDGSGLSGFGVCLLLGAVGVLALAVADGTKWSFYGIHTIPWLAAIAAFGFRDAWCGSRTLRITAVTFAAAYIAVPVAIVVVVASRDSMKHLYRPAVEALEKIDSHSLAFAPPEFVFAYPGPFVFDSRLGFVSHKSPAGVAVSRSALDGALQWARQGSPPLYAYLAQKFNRDCRKTYENSEYEVFDCRSASDAVAPAK